MISTVTTVTTTAAGTSAAVAGFGLIAALALIALLITKELAGAVSENSSAPEFTMPGTMDRTLNVGIVPLSMVFVTVVFAQIVNIL